MEKGQGAQNCGSRRRSGALALDLSWMFGVFWPKQFLAFEVPPPEPKLAEADFESVSPSLG